MTIGIVIQCHDKSTRLPHKIFKELGDMSILEHVVVTCCMSMANIVIIATTSDESNKSVLDLVNTFSHKYQKLHTFVYNGNDSDVLERYYGCAEEYKLDTIVRITSDCPMHSYHIINLAIKTYHYTNSDYLSFLSIDGIDTEVFSFKALEEAQNNATTSEEREHVTTYIKERSSLKKGRLEDVKLSIDTVDDFNRVQEIHKCQG